MIITRTIINMSYKIIETYNNKNPKTLEFKLLCRDSDKIENITYIDKISHLSFNNTINIQHLIDQNKFSVRNARDKTNEQVFKELDNICLTIINHQFELTKVLDFEFSSDFEKKIIQSFKLSDEKFNSKIDSICNNYCKSLYYTNYYIINYYKKERMMFQIKLKLIQLKNNSKYL